MRKPYQIILPMLLVCFVPAVARAQSFRVQCPTSTITHPDASKNNSEPAYTGPTTFTPDRNGGQYLVPTAGTVNGAIKCQQISGGDGYMTEGDGTQTFMFSFGPLSGLSDVAAGLPSTQFPSMFNTPYPGTLVRGDPAATDGATSGATPWTGAPSSPFVDAFGWNGAVGLAPEVVQTVNISDLVVGSLTAVANVDATPTAPGCPTPADGSTVTAYTFEPVGIPVGSTVFIAQSLATPGEIPAPQVFLGTFKITCVSNNALAPSAFSQYAFQYTDAAAAGQTWQQLLQGVTVSSPPVINGHVDPRQIMDIGVMNGNIPAPLAAFDEDDEFFLTLTNVGMIMRPDLQEQHTVHFHGYPNASSFYDGVPDASVAINIGGSFTYYYLAPDAGTYFWHCHITPPEHLQMGMVGQLYVRPRQDRVPAGNFLYASLQQQNSGVDLRTACNPAADILCSAVTPPADSGTKRAAAGSLCSNPTATGSGVTPDYVYNDGDGSSCYDVTYPIQMHGFDPNFHFVGMTFNPELFVDMKDKYFLLNGRSYPDTIAPGPQGTVSSDGQMHYSQPLPAIINIPAGGKASLRLANLSVAEYFTLQTLGIPMHVVGWNAKLLRDQAGNNTEYWSNSITLGGGESNDVILDASDAGCGTPGCAATLYPAGSVFYLYEPDLDRLSNDAENFGGMMTEVHICKSVSGGNTFGNSCN
jgi:FtsP/CotA-like multicopper oxidase with cupredoxin domain